MSDFNVGVVRAGMSLDLAQLRRQIEQATSQMKKLTDEVQRATSATQQKITSAQDKELQKQLQQARAVAEKEIAEVVRVAKVREGELKKQLQQAQKIADKEVAESVRVAKTKEAELQKQLQQSRKAAEKEVAELLRVSKTKEAELRKQIDQQARAAARQNEIVKRAVQRDVAEFEKASQARVRAFEKEMREQQRLQQQQQQARQKLLNQVPTAARGVSSAAMGVALPVLGGLGAAAREAAQFDQAMRNVDSIAHLTDQQLQNLRGSLLSIAKDDSIRQMPTDLAKGLYQVYSAGQEGAKALKTLEWGAKGASAGITDTETSTRVLLAVMNSGIKGFQDQKEAMDILFQEVNLGVNSFGELANSLGNVLPIASMMGVSLQEISAGMVVMTRAGIGAEESVTALNQLLTHIAKPGQEAERMMNQLGIAYGSGALEAQGLAGWLEQVIQKTKGNKDEIMHLIPEIRGSKALMSLLADGIKGYNGALADMQNASKGAGQTQEALTRQNKGAVAQWEMLKKNISLVGIEIGDKLLPSVNSAIGYFRRWLEQWGKLPQGVKDSQVQMALFLGGMAGGTAIISTFVGWTASLVRNLETLAVVAPRVVAGLGFLFRFGAPAAVAAAGMYGEGLGDGTLPKSNMDKLLSAQKSLRNLEPITKTPPPMRQDWQDWRKKYASPEGFKAAQAEVARLKRAITEYKALIKREIADAGDDGGNDAPNPFPLNSSGFNRDDFKKSKGGGGRGASSAVREMEGNIREYTQQTEELLRLRLGESSARIYRIHQEYMEALKNPFTKKRAGSVMAAQLKEEFAKINKAAADAKDAAFDSRNAMDFRAEQSMTNQLAELEAGREKALEDRAQMDMKWAEATARQLGEFEGELRGKIATAFGNQFAAQQYSDEQARLRREMQDYMDKLRHETGFYSDKDYYTAKMKNSMVMGTPTKETYEAWKSLIDSQMSGAGKGGMKKFSEEFEQSRQMAENAMRNVSAGMMNILGNSFRKAFKGDFGEMFGNILFNLLSDVISNAISSAFKKSTKGGKGLGIGGAVGATLDIFSMFGFGFDDAANDRTAHGWGWDFAKHFGNGVKQFQNRQADFVPTRAAAAGGNQSVNVTVNYTGQGSDMDYGELGRRVAWEVQKELRRTV